MNVEKRNAGCGADGAGVAGTGPDGLSGGGALFLALLVAVGFEL